MRYLKKYKLFESSYLKTELKEICDNLLVSLKDINFNYYVGYGESSEGLIEIYNNEIDDYDNYELFEWTTVKEEVITLISYLTEKKYIINDILILYNALSHKPQIDSYYQQNLTADDILNETDKIYHNISEIKIYIENK